MVTNGAVDRAVHAWIADECSRSTVKNSLAVVIRVMEQALRDGIIDRNPARVTGWQREYKLAEDELDDPRALALPDWNALTTLADALVTRSLGRYQGWGDAVIFEACTAARIGEVSGCLVRDLNTEEWIWTVRRQTTPSPGGLVDKNTKGKRAREVPLIDAIRDLVDRRMDLAGHDPDARLPMLDCSPVPGADVSPPPPCATPRHGTTWSPSWATSTSSVTAYGTRG